MIPIQGQQKSKGSRKRTNPQITKPDSPKKQITKMKSSDSNIRDSKEGISPQSSSNPRIKNPRFNSFLIKSEYLVDIQNYKIISNPKHGGFGVVNFVEEKKTGEKYAAKTSLYGAKGDEFVFVLREINILLHFQHETVVKFHGVSYKDFNGEDNITIFMKFMENGSLANLLKKERKSHFVDNTKKQIILVGIARGMMLLHKHHIIHRDLKPDNVLLDDELKPHITDFGLSKIFDPLKSGDQSMFGGTLFYKAPEIIKCSRYNTKADVYSFGILMYEVLTGISPYQELYKNKNLPRYEFEQKVLSGVRPQFNEDDHMKKGLKKMIELCWSDDPNERPSFAEIYSKLSCADESFYIDSDNICKPIIRLYYNDDDDDENEGFIHSNYCLDDVDIDELFMYVDDISGDAVDDKHKKNDDTQSLKKIEEKMKELINDNIQLKKEVAELKKIISSNAIKIPSPKTDDEKQQKQDMKNQSNEISDDDLKNQCFELSKKVEKNQIKNVVLPESLKKIPFDLFKDSTKLESVKIPTSVNEIETCAFYNCSSLKSIDIPSSVKKIGASAFYGCSSIKSIEIPSSVNEIGESSFKRCSKLTIVKMLSNVIELPSSLFSECSSLKNFKIPSSVKKIGLGAFLNCFSLSNIDIPSSVEVIESYAFNKCKSLTSFIFPKSISTIENGVLKNCTSLEFVEIPSSVTTIRSGAFSNCQSLKEIMIPSSIETIEETAFTLCSSLKTIKIPSSFIPTKNAFPANAEIIKY